MGEVWTHTTAVIAGMHWPSVNVLGSCTVEIRHE